MQKCLVLGVGSLGRRVLHELKKQGVDAVGASRTRPKGLDGEWIQTDARVADEVRKAAQGCDTVVLCAAPPLTSWSAEFEELVKGTLQGLRGLETTVVFASNMFVYGPSAQPMSEQTPEQPQAPIGRLRKELDKLVLAEHGVQGTRTAVVRGSSFYGPGVDVSMVGTSQLQSAAQGKPVDALGSVDQPHSLCFIDDFARAIVQVAANPSAHGQVWHAPVQPAMTMREFMELVTDKLGTELKFRIATPLILRIMGIFSPTMRALKQSFYQYTAPFIVDDSKYRAAFEESATPLNETIDRTIGSAGLSAKGSS